MRKKCRFILAVFLMLLSISATAQSGGGKVTLNLKKVSITFFIDAVKKQTNQNFFYSSDLFEHEKPVTVIANDENWEPLVQRVLAQRGFEFVVKNGIVVIRKKAANKSTVVRGTVLDASGDPIPGATLMIKGTRVGTTTDIDGRFTFVSPVLNPTLEVSFIGMKKQNVKVNSANNRKLTIVLQEDVATIDNVVVTGYGNVRKSSFTGSSTQITGSELRKVSQTNILDAIQSFDPSFKLVKDAQFGSDPNNIPEMYIRGRSGFGIKEMDKADLSRSNLENNPNLPTFIMDGFEVSPEKIYDLDPNRIESITILKDAAATAMYGSRAANGVIVINTVAPKAGELRINYNLVGTLEMPDLHDYNRANASEKLEIERLAGLYDRGTAGDMAASMNRYYEKYACIQQGIDTDWMKIPLRNAFDHKHSLYVEGGTPNLRYGVDGMFSNANGVMKGTSRDKYSLGVSLDYRMKKIQVKNTVSFSHMKADDSPYGSFRDYTKLLPYDTPYDMDGKLVRRLRFSMANGRFVNNPLYEAKLNNYGWNKYDEIIDNLSMNWYFLDHWTLKGQFSVRKQYNSSERFIDPLSSYTTINKINSSLSGDLYTMNGNSLYWNTNAFIYYSNTIKKNSLNFSAGWEAMSRKTDRLSAHYRGFPSGDLHSINYASEIYKKPIKGENQTRMVSFLSSANYTWDDIYLADLAVRFDGSSEFGSNQKWAPFFSGGLGLNIHNYKFLKKSEYVNKLKLRMSYGRTGKVNFAPYAASTIYKIMFDEWYKTGYGAVLMALGNEDLTWEKTDKFDIGLETSFFNDRLMFNIEYYYDKTIDLVNDFTLSHTSGFSTYKNNMGEVANKGVEMSLRASVFRNKDWRVDLWGNLAHNKNEILKISNSQKAYNDKIIEFYEKETLNQVIAGTSLKDAKYSVPLLQYTEGGSLTSIWAVRSLGIDPTTGKEIFLNRDGTVSDHWDATQQVVVGNTEPDFNGNIGFDITYKNWSLSSSFSFEWGGQEYNQTLVDNVENADIANSNVDLRVLTDRWKNVGDIKQFKDIRDAGLTTLPTSRFVQNNKLFRMNALRLSYDFDRSWIKKHFHMNMLRLELASSNLINWSSIKQERGLDYPRSWKVEFSLKTQF